MARKSKRAVTATSDAKALPVGWKIMHLSAVIRDITAGVSVNGEDREAYDGELGVLKLNSVSNGRFLPEENKAVLAEDCSRVSVSPKAGDVLISRANGSLDLVGATVYINENHNTLFLPDLIWRLTTDPLQDNSRWLHYVLASPDGRRSIESRVVGSNGTHKISQASLRSIEVVRPPLPEQERIVDLLSTWDKAIELTEKLIAAKQKRKQALMQQLLSGKVRLIGFGKKWKAIKAGAIFKQVSVKNHPDERVLSVTQDMGVVYRDEMERRIGMNTDTTGTYKLVEPGDFVISLRSFQGGLEMSRVRGIVSPAYHVIQPAIEVDREFFRHFFKSYEFIGRLAVAVIGIRDGKQINYDDFAFLRFLVPPIEEQMAISAVLSAAEYELAVTERKALKLKQQKKALMQKLLTGKVRFKSED